MLAKILEGQAKTHSCIEKIQASQDLIEKKISAIAERIDKVDEQLEKLSSLPSKVQDVEGTVTKLNEEIVFLANKVDELENRSRRINLVIYGIEEPRGETADDLLKKVNDDIFRDTLQVAISGIERCHRIGQKAKDKS
ncbi:hypothetical protein HPB48_008940 [Haemaphysalis longicornis]|uniref:Uncharacterized protein n=1 Tax=Haemaphysalis longicornis TaxID=44386 RepID=A0A9J6GAL3_HAELO|nr:hypothetical protein HPB48_008940 [Haemaphysalis longicornis]